jgi:aminoglycoside phosphotransferase (APT) family kinase protein
MTPPKKIDKSAAEQVIEHHFGKKPRDVQQIHGGKSNFVFEAAVDGEELVLRISQNPTKLQSFMKEQWVVRKVREKKVPAPEILEVANDVIGVPYMIMRKVVGRPATVVPNHMEVLREMGHYTALINSIATTDFGHNFDWSPNELSRHHSWKEYLEDGLRVDGLVKTFTRSKILSAANLKKIKEGVKRLASLTGKPTLNHGDMRLKNVMLDDKDAICAIIDWEHATSNLAPYWELAIALHDLGIDEREAFLEGYGLAPKDYGKVSDAVKVLNILHYASVVGTVLKRKDRARLAHLEQRLNGAHDLYSL